MMMAHDSSPPRRELSASAIAGLEKALGEYLAKGAEPSVLQAALRVITAEAREKQIHAEQLLVLMKDLWFGLPKIKAAAPGEHHSDMLQRAVTLCIREYYAS